MYSLNIVYLYIYPLTFVKIATVFNILLYNRPELTMGRACRPTDPLINFYDWIFVTCFSDRLNLGQKCSGVLLNYKSVSCIWTVDYFFYFHACSKKFICYMNKYLCHVQDILLLRIVVLQHLGILRMVDRLVVSDLNWPVCYRRVMGHTSYGSILWWVSWVWVKLYWPIVSTDVYRL